MSINAIYNQKEVMLLAFIGLSGLDKRIEMIVHNIISANKQLRQLEEESAGKLQSMQKRISELQFLTYYQCLTYIAEQLQKSNKVDDLPSRSWRIFQKALSCPRITELYNEARLAKYDEMGKDDFCWVLDLRSSDNDFSTFKKAFCNPSRRSIVIDSRLSDDEILALFVFELTNAASSKEIYQIHRAAFEGKISREDFACSLERLEHEGTLKHSSIMNHAVAEMGWDRSLKDYYDENPLEDFDEYWPLIKDDAHTNGYRNQWDKIQKKT